MTAGQPARSGQQARQEGPPASTGPAPAAAAPARPETSRIAPITMLAGTEAEGGDSACWAHLVCPECGAIVSEGHRQGCGSGPGAVAGD